MSKKQKSAQVTEAAKIAKVILYISVLLILARCDLWINIIVLVMVCLYMLQANMLNKSLGNVNKMASKCIVVASALMKQWYEQNINTGNDVEQQSSQHSTINVNSAQNETSEDLLEDCAIPLPPEWFEDDSFDVIWSQDEH